MSAKRDMRGVLRALLLFAATALPAVWTGPWATARVFSLCIAPGAALVLLALPGLVRDRSRALVAVILASAVLSPLSSLILLRSLGSFDATVVPQALFWGLILAGASLTRRAAARPSTLPAAPRTLAARIRRSELAAIALATLVIGLPLLLNADLRQRSDAWTHIALVREVMRGPGPWTDPRFAGEPLRYFWFLNVWAGGLVARGGTSIPWALAWINLAQLTAWVAAAFTITRRLFAQPRLRRAALALIAFGLNPLGLLGVVTHPLQGLIGATHGDAALRAGMSKLQFLNADVIYALTPHTTFFVAWIDKFLVVTAFGIGMTGALFLAGTLWEAIRDGELRGETLALLAIGLAAVLLHHLVAGAFLGVTLGAALLVPRLLGRTPLGWRSTLLGLAVMAAVALATLPYQASILLGREAGDSGFGIALQGVWVRTTLVTLGPLLALLVVGRRECARLLGRAALPALVFVAVSLALILFVAMPSVNENKLIILAFCAAAPLGAPGLLALHERLRRGRFGRGSWRVLAAAAMLVPALIWFGHLVHRDPRVPADASAACAWIRAHTPPAAVLIEPEERRFAMNRAARDMLASDRTFIRECGYPRAPLMARLDLIGRLYRDGALTPPDRELLTALGRPVYALYVRDAGAGAGASPDPAPGDFEEVFSRPGAAVYRFLPGGANR
jgi:hypothetical protein